MQVVSTIAEARAVLDGTRRMGRQVGLVPTMGYLHAGHMSLIERSVAAGDHVTMVTIFVNPLQFAANEDLASYPRDLERDLAQCEAAGAALVLTPSVEEMYPRPVLTTVSVAELSQRMEGAARPTHFDGVATVVTKLFAIAGPCRAYFGEKDFQQLAVVRRLAADLSLPVEVVGCPIVREPDGLAMSSRNVYLNAEERIAALVLHRSLLEAEQRVRGDGERDPVALAAAVLATLAREPLAEPDYAEVVDPATLAPLTDPLVPGQEIRIIVAARVGRPRLLDNLGVVVPT